MLLPGTGMDCSHPNPDTSGSSLCFLCALRGKFSVPGDDYRDSGKRESSHRSEHLVGYDVLCLTTHREVLT